MKGVVSNRIIQIKITTPKVIPLATEVVEKKKAVLRGNGFVELAPHQLTRGLKKFLEGNGLTMEYSTTEGRRGKVEIAGVKVKVLPVNHTNYDGGVLIKVTEKDGMSYTNINKVLAYLTKRGINIAQECIHVDEHNQEKACLFKAAE